MMSQRMLRRAVSIGRGPLGMLLVANTCMALAIGAQTPVVFVHGLASNGSTWQVAAQRLQQDLNVTTTTPNLPSFDSFENQANALITDEAGLASNAVAIGHSNGGTVSRMANIDGRPWAGIITVATPHYGSVLAQNAIDGVVFEEARFLIESIATPFQIYSDLDPDNFGWTIAGDAANWATDVAEQLPYAAAAFGYWADNTVLTEMVPGSPFLTQTVNSNANLNREAAAVPQRLYVASTIEYSWGEPWHALSPGSWQSITEYWYGAAAELEFAGDYYDNYDNVDDPYYWEKVEYAYYWYIAADAMIFTDQNWCGIIGAVNNYFICTPNDGIVPTGGQVYPGATGGVTIVGPSHFEETSDDQVYQNLNNFLRTRFNVGSAGAGGGGGTTSPLSVAIQGPASIGLCSGSWIARGSGGSSPYHYNWTVNGQPYSTDIDDELDYTPSRVGRLYIGATVTDGQGVTSSTTLNASVTSGGPC